MKFKILLASFLFLIALGLQPVLAQDIVKSEKSQMSAEDLEAYWTDERMRNAEPYPMYSPEEANVMGQSDSAVDLVV